MAWRIEPGENLPDAFRRVAAEEIAQARGRLQSTDRDRDEAIHVARRSFKRLRALLRLARPTLGDRFAAENRRWRDAGRMLAPLRDAAVLRATFDAVVEGADLALPSDELARVRARLNGASGPGSEPDIERAVRDVLKTLDAAEADLSDLEPPARRKELAKGLRAGQKRLRRCFKAADANPSPENLHEWRKRVKDCAANLRLFRAVLSEDFRKCRDDADELADILGKEHDLTLLREVVVAEKLPADLGKARRLVLGRLGKERRKLCRQALKKGRDMSSLRPKSFARDLARMWHEAEGGVAPDARS